MFTTAPQILLPSYYSVYVEIRPLAKECLLFQTISNPQELSMKVLRPINSLHFFSYQCRIIIIVIKLIRAWG